MQSEYSAGIQTQSKTNYIHYTATVKMPNSNITTLTTTIDSLDQNRPGVEDYTVIAVEPLQKLKL